MQDIQIIALKNQTEKLVDLSQRQLTDRQAHQLVVQMFSVANQWLRAPSLGLCTWTVGKENAAMLDRLSIAIDESIGAA